MTPLERIDELSANVGDPQILELIAIVRNMLPETPPRERFLESSAQQYKDRMNALAFGVRLYFSLESDASPERCCNHLTDMINEGILERERDEAHDELAEALKERDELRELLNEARKSLEIRTEQRETLQDKVNRVVKALQS